MHNPSSRNHMRWLVSWGFGAAFAVAWQILRPTATELL
jgi:hypothetical protein